MERLEQEYSLNSLIKVMLLLKAEEFLTIKQLKSKLNLTRQSIMYILKKLKQNNLVLEIESINLITRRKIKKYKITEKGLMFLREIYEDG